MKMLLSLALLVGALQFTAACVTAESLSVSQLPPAAARKSVVTAQASKPIIFRIPFGTSHIVGAQQELLQACPHGAIEGVLAKQESTNYFLGFVRVETVSMRGYCVSKKGA